jgi:hypothetical protein
MAGERRREGTFRLAVRWRRPRSRHRVRHALWVPGVQREASRWSRSDLNPAASRCVRVDAGPDESGVPSVEHVRLDGDGVVSVEARRATAASGAPGRRRLARAPGARARRAPVGCSGHGPARVFAQDGRGVTMPCRRGRSPGRPGGDALHDRRRRCRSRAVTSGPAPRAAGRRSRAVASRMTNPE